MLLDTGVIVALLDADDSLHQRCADAIADLKATFVTCEPVITESCYLLRHIQGAPEAVLESVATREFQIPRSLADSSPELRKHSQRSIATERSTWLMPFLFIWLTEWNTADILTVDRDFQIYRWGRNNPFRMLVPLD